MVLLFHHFSTHETVLAYKKDSKFTVWFSGYQPIDLAVSLLNHLNIPYEVYELTEQNIEKNNVPYWVHHAENISHIYRG